MTNWEGTPLRPQGQAWPGLNTRGGRLSKGTGQLEDGSINQIINEADTLEKRKGFVRGLNERFNGVVCGLFKYTDDCGVEWLVVADETGIFIRQPFTIPVFQQSDAYPFDSFSELEINTTNWRNTTDYETSNDEMVQRFGLPAISGNRIGTADIMRWFKEASNQSYQIRIAYGFDDIATEQHKAIIIKGTGDLSTGAFLQGEVIFSNTGTYRAVLFHKTSTGSVVEILNRDLEGQRDGFFTVQYQRDSNNNLFVPGFQAAPRGGTPITANAETLNAVQDANFGQVTGLGIGYRSGAQGFPGIDVVDGGPI